MVLCYPAGAVLDKWAFAAIDKGFCTAYNPGFPPSSAGSISSYGEFLGERLRLTSLYPLPES
jgi:hypothetical protein